MARPGLERHVKFKTLVRMLGCPRPLVRGCLEFLWEVAYENGDPHIGSAEQVEAAAEWPGEAGKLVEALAMCGGEGRPGFIEPSTVGPGFQIHDLYDHAPDYVASRACREAERKKNRTCALPGCGVVFNSTETHATYCSPACRTKAWRSRSCDAPRRGVTEGSVTVTERDEPPSTQHPAHSTQARGEDPPRTPPPVSPDAAKPPRRRSQARKTAKASEVAQAVPDAGAGEQSPALAESGAKPPRPRDLLFDAVAEITGSDPALSGGRIAKLCKSLRSARPPYTPEDVRATPQAIADLGWGVSISLTLNNLLEHVAKTRMKPTRIPAAEKASDLDRSIAEALGPSRPLKDEDEIWRALEAAQPAGVS